MAFAGPPGHTFSNFSVEASTRSIHCVGLKIMKQFSICFELVGVMFVELVYGRFLSFTSFPCGDMVGGGPPAFSLEFKHQFLISIFRFLWRGKFMTRKPVLVFDISL